LGPALIDVLERGRDEESVSDGRDRLDPVWAADREPELAADVTDMGLEHPRVQAVVSPGVLEQPRERHDPARIHHQEAEDAELEWGQLDAHATAASLMRLEVEEDIADAELRRIGATLALPPADDGAHAREKLRDVKRLADEIIRT
jgi:hypothetical protein